jgi:hypothetical protein
VFAIMYLGPLNMDPAGLSELISGVTDYAWLFDWGIFLFLLATLGVTAWIFFDSTQKRKADKALIPRIMALVGTFFVMPAFIFRFTGNADGVNIVVKMADGSTFPNAIRWNVAWLAAGYGPKIAMISLLGVALCIFAAIMYASTVSRSRPSTEFMSAMNNQFGELRQELQHVKSRSAVSTSAETVAPGMTMGAAVGQSPVPAPSRSAGAATIIGNAGGRGAAATIIERPGVGKCFAELRVVSGGRVGQRWELPAQDIKLGRDATNLVSLDDGKASREHAKIRFADGEFVIMDLGSSNGTFVNDAELTAQRTLNDGDLVRVGDTVMAFKLVKAL